jgi:hypothetical protein
MKKSLLSILLLTAFSSGTFGQKYENLIGTWKQNGFYWSKENVITEGKGEPYPFNTIQLNADGTCVISCFSTHPEDFKSKSEYWTLVGRWKFRDPEITLIKTRNRETNKKKLLARTFRVVFSHEELHIDYGFPNDPDKVYVKYFRIN